MVGLINKSLHPHFHPRNRSHVYHESQSQLSRSHDHDTSRTNNTNNLSSSLDFKYTSTPAAWVPSFTQNEHLFLSLFVCLHETWEWLVYCVHVTVLYMRETRNILIFVICVKNSSNLHEPIVEQLICSPYKSSFSISLFSAIHHRNLFIRGWV